MAWSVTVKANVVGQDPRRPACGRSSTMHAFGHAVELRENFHWRHGNAVAVGMMFIAHLAQQRGLIDADLVARHAAILESIGLPVSYEPRHFDELYAGMTRDKKNRDGHIRFVALTGPGQTTRPRVRASTNCAPPTTRSPGRRDEGPGPQRPQPQPPGATPAGGVRIDDARGRGEAHRGAGRDARRRGGVPSVQPRG
ncbi:hypothetical protein QP028_15090 [Corynebacterium suedekumii]|nr:hypothetical protein QP028_15090 [Corynebacterium suedekumii]